jgi:ABC-type nitrate/sulfonate/bicarbonate transport system substrate-binding protein
MFRRLVFFVFILVAFMIGVSVPVRSQTVKTVRLMTPTLGTSAVIYEVATRFGFYQQEGLRVELIRAPLATSIQAVLGGSADYARHGSVIGAVLGAVPFKALAVDTDKSLQYVVAKKEIGSLKELVGKTVAIDDIGGAAYWSTRETLAKNGLPVDKINFRRIGGPELRFQALMAGVVDAAPLNFVMSGRAKEKDFRVLVFTGDFVTDVQLLIAAPADKIHRSPEDVYKFVKATMKGRQFQFENPDEAYKFYLELEQLNDSKFARDGWEDRLRSSSPSAKLGFLSDQAMVESISGWKEQMALGGRPLKVEGRPEDVYDFSFVKRANKDIKAEGFDAKKYRYVTKR